MQLVEDVANIPGQLFFLSICNFTDYLFSDPNFSLAQKENGKHHSKKKGDLIKIVPATKILVYILFDFRKIFKP